MINVTKTYLPPLEQYIKYLEGIWARGQVTNNGPLVRELENKLKAFLGVKHIFFVSNGTIALQIAIKALDLQGEVLTTPFSYVATTSSIIWENCTPVFVDIDQETLCLNPDLIEVAITPRTTAILAVHVYGHPCDVKAIQAVADRHRLKVIYDAAHAFAVSYEGEPLLAHGDISTLSFHATKLFHTVEGGAVVTNDDEIAHRLSYLRNFGHKGQEDFWGIGVNGKNSEFHAAMGLCVLERVPELVAKRQVVSEMYDDLFEGNSLSRPRRLTGTVYNYAYYPVLFPSERNLLYACDALRASDIYPRRYFYPSLNTIGYIAGERAQVAEDVASRVLCLPLYDSLDCASVERIASIVNMGLGPTEHL